ncbi:glycosyltransferase [uncultured Pseudodesulfovibrio sp.]|uniref:glycosyltransferase n=1 Tax=uncultured Pseudodesulfovibrio sp. TaxID=2035858 RepID=UPI0029C78815|nr:glycosyltransferase [uncultured Pseudodesulfovibrio sp.]
MSRRIRIAFVIDYIESPTAGTEKQLNTILDNLDTEVFHPCLCILRESEWSRSQYKGEIHHADVPSVSSLSFVPRLLGLARYLRENRFDIVHTFHRDGDLFGTIAARIAGIPVVIGSRRDQGYWLNWKERGLRRLIRRFQTHYITNAHSTRKQMMAQENIPASIIEVIPNGIDLSLFSSSTSREPLRAEWGMDDKDVVIGCVATLRPVKDHDGVLKGFAQACSKNARLRLVLVGDGRCRDDLERLASELGVRSKVTFLGKRRDIPAILSALDVGLLFSKSESMSNTILEYLAAGLPVVCSDVGDASEMVNGENGALVPQGDIPALAEGMLSLGDADVRTRMGAESRSRSRQYEIGLCMERFRSFYMRCVS